MKLQSFTMQIFLQGRKNMIGIRGVGKQAIVTGILEGEQLNPDLPLLFQKKVSGLHQLFNQIGKGQLCQQTLGNLAAQHVRQGNKGVEMVFLPLLAQFFFYGLRFK